MDGLWSVALLGTLLITHTGFVCSDNQFLERNEGDSVVLRCVTEPRSPPPYGFYLKRSWLHPEDVLYKATGNNFSVQNDEDKSRVDVSGDPSIHSLTVTISDLSVRDTGHYYCEFLVDNPLSEDDVIRGTTEFFLLVNAIASGSLDIRVVETCSGASAVLPCLPAHGETLEAVEGVSLKRQRGRAPVEMLYNSKQDHGSSPPSSSSSQFPVERVQLFPVPGPRGITFNLTLHQLQPEDSGMYSCQLLLHGRSDSRTSLGREVFFVSVQGDSCGCSHYVTLLYALSSAVVFLLLLLVAFVLIFKGKARRSVKSHPQVPIYEEMTGLQAETRKLPPHKLEETECSEYRNCPVKKSCPENHYESPSGGLAPCKEFQT